MRTHAILIFSALSLLATPAVAANAVKFGKTCIGHNGSTRDICLSFDGKTVSSSYKFRGSIPTRGTHTGCSVKGNTLSCSGGAYRTSRGSGEMNPVVIKLSNGKPVSVRWR